MSERPPTAGVNYDDPTASPNFRHMDISVADAKALIEGKARIVPVEPTHEMINRGYEAIRGFRAKVTRVTLTETCYKAMIKQEDSK